ncbi:MAG: GldG family protein [Gammaproteobacteria bacterium]|nr:GldG family protein [Gammaproteobacteria bacterium]
MMTTPKKKRQLRIQSYLFTLLFLSVTALLGWFSTQYSISTDWTYGQRNSLSASTVRLLKTMPDPLNINIYLPDQASARQAVDELFKRYQSHKKNFNYKLLNPDLDIELAKADNISRYGQVVIKYRNRTERLDNVNESLLGNALSRLSREQLPHAVFIQGHGERNPLSQDNPGFSKLAAALSEKGIKVSPHNLLSGVLPQDTSIVVIAGPLRAYLPGETERLQQYIKSGGNLLWLQEPDNNAALQPLTQQLQLSFEPGILVDADPELRATLRIEHPATIAVLQYNLHPITRNIPYNTLFMLAGSVDFLPSDQSDWEATTLFSSRPSTWSETGTLLSKEIKFEKNKGDRLGPLPMAQALQRNNRFTETSKSQRVVVVADSDFLANNYLGAAANLMLGENIFNWLSRDEQLLSFEIKTAPDLTLQLSDTQISFIGLSFLLLMPAGLLLTGFIIWRKRRQG